MENDIEEVTSGIAPKFLEQYEAEEEYRKARLALGDALLEFERACFNKLRKDLATLDDKEDRLRHLVITVSCHTATWSGGVTSKSNVIEAKVRQAAVSILEDEVRRY